MSAAEDATVRDMTEELFDKIEDVEKRNRWKDYAQLFKKVTVPAPTLARMCERFGVAPPREFDRDHVYQEVEMISLGEFCDGVYDAGSAVELCEAQGLKATHLSDTPVKVTQLGEKPTNCYIIGGYGNTGLMIGGRMASGATYSIEDLQDVPDEEQGTPGTQVYSGIVQVDPSPRMQPYSARGFAGYPGIYEESLREPLIYQSLQSIRQLLVSGVWSLQIPDDVPEEERGRLEEACDEIWAALNSIDGGWEGYLEHACTNIIFGFSIFEVVWKRLEDGKLLPKKIAFREPSTVERWLMSARQDELLGVKFQTGGEASYSYVLPKVGDRTEHHRILLNTLGGRGNNFEGIPPTRTIDTIRVHKQLLIQIAAACNERFGAPILTTKFDPALKDMPGMQPREDKWQDFFDFLQYMQAMDTPTARVPLGLMIEYVGPGGTMPNFEKHLEYLDSQIMLAFSNQGALLGQQSVHGSYALAQTQDDQFMRAAPYYARVCVRSLNELIKVILRNEYGFELIEWPCIKWRLAGEHDSSRWFDDLTKFMALKDSLPPAILKAGLEKLGLPADSFDEVAARQEEVDEPESEPDPEQFDELDIDAEGDE